MHEYMALLDKETIVRDSPEKNTIRNRLYPPGKGELALTTTMPNAIITNNRAHKKRFEIMFGTTSLHPRYNSVDVCTTCGVDRAIDKETSITVCPKCGSVQRFASHIFETKDVEKDDSVSTRQTNMTHLQKFSSQFEFGYPVAPVSVLDAMSVAYSKIHSHDPSKVKLCKTSAILKGLKDIPKIFKRAPDRLTKELKRESIPEYTSQELSLLLNQRNQFGMQVSESGDKKQKKSFNGHVYMRQLGRANQMEQSRLFPQQKTAKIHYDRIRAMEQECDAQKKQDTNVGSWSWDLYPST
jgi:hypothetical protein